MRTRRGEMEEIARPVVVGDSESSPQRVHLNFKSTRQESKPLKLFRVVNMYEIGNIRIFKVHLHLRKCVSTRRSAVRFSLKTPLGK